MRTRLRISLAAAFSIFNMGSASAVPRPTVIELFTSEGCSSCPPAENYLAELAQNPNVLALAFHVDYWDDLGWPDRFGIKEAAPRQRVYATLLSHSNVYTPQLVIDGQSAFVGTDRTNIAKALVQARDGIAVVLTVGGDAIDIDVSERPGITLSDVVLVTYADAVRSPILRGENAGRVLQEVHVVRSIQTLGEFVGRAHRYRADRSTLPADATHVAVLVQSTHQGTIAAASVASLR